MSPQPSEIAGPVPPGAPVAPGMGGVTADSIRGQAGTAPSDAILERLMTLHPKIIDLTLDRMHRLLAQLGHRPSRPVKLFLDSNEVISDFVTLTSSYCFLARSLTTLGWSHQLKPWV